MKLSTNLFLAALGFVAVNADNVRSSLTTDTDTDMLTESNPFDSKDETDFELDVTDLVYKSNGHVMIRMSSLLSSDAMGPLLENILMAVSESSNSGSADAALNSQSDSGNNGMYSAYDDSADNTEFADEKIESDKHKVYDDEDEDTDVEEDGSVKGGKYSLDDDEDIEAVTSKKVATDEESDHGIEDEI